MLESKSCSSQRCLCGACVTALETSAGAPDRALTPGDTCEWHGGGSVQMMTSGNFRQRTLVLIFASVPSRRATK
jgi:hypothetical protein